MLDYLATFGLETPMSEPISPSMTGFVDRRSAPSDTLGRERRQFTNSYEELSPDAREFARAVDAYKLSYRRRFITYEEILDVAKSLGYHK